jgi:DNA polymerase III gamma/tau subunit
MFWQDLIGLYRDMLVMKTTKNAAAYLDLADSEAAELTALSEKFSKPRLLAHCRLLEEALFAMQKANAVKRMVAELTLLQMADERLDDSGAGLLARLERLEERLVTGDFSAPAVAPAPKKEAPKQETPKTEKAKEEPKAPVAPAPVAPVSPTAKSGGRTLTRLRGFANCVARIGRDNAMVASFLGEARAYLDEQQRAVILLPNTFAEMMLEQAGGRDVLRHALCLELQREVKDRDLLIEVASTEQEKNDTVIDDILSAAE